MFCHLKEVIELIPKKIDNEKIIHMAVTKNEEWTNTSLSVHSSLKNSDKEEKLEIVNTIIEMLIEELDVNLDEIVKFNEMVQGGIL